MGVIPRNDKRYFWILDFGLMFWFTKDTAKTASLFPPAAEQALVWT